MTSSVSETASDPGPKTPARGSRKPPWMEAHGSHTPTSTGASGTCTAPFGKLFLPFHRSASWKSCSVVCVIHWLSKRCRSTFRPPQPGKTKKTPTKIKGNLERRGQEKVRREENGGAESPPSIEQFGCWDSREKLDVLSLASPIWHMKGGAYK